VINRVLRKVPLKKRIAAVNLSTTRAVDDIVKKHEGKLYKSPVGEINVIQKMMQTNAVIGGEGSGGVIFPEIHYGRDSLAGIALILSELAETGLNLSKYKKLLPEYHIEKSRIETEGIDTDSILQKISTRYKKSPQNDEDGLKIDFKDSWVNFRKSNTEPIIRIIAEAKSKRKARELVQEFRDEILKLAGKV
jgi:phosphomannomutase